MISKYQNLTQPGSKKNFKFKIFDLVSLKFIYESIIYSKPLIGMLKSGLYTFVEGHMYYNNDVIKIRYDLISHPNSHQYKESEIFDYYFDIFALGDNEKVKSDTPLDCIKAHRFAYIISDIERRNPQMLLILPYLHEKSIYINRMKQDTDYFYTSITTSNKDEELYHKFLDDIREKQSNLKNKMAAFLQKQMNAKVKLIN